MSTQEMTSKNEKQSRTSNPSEGSIRVLANHRNLAGGAFTLFDAVCPPGFATPPHIHYAEDVAVFVLEGTLTSFWGANNCEARAGSFLFQPRGTPHGFRVRGDSPARILYTTIPVGFDLSILEHQLTSQKLTLKGMPLDTRSRFLDHYPNKHIDDALVRR